MDDGAQVNIIYETFQDVRNVSFHEKRDGLNGEEQINKFLDHLLDLQKVLNTKSLTIEAINQRMEGLTWLNNISESDLKKINDLIASVRDLYSILIRQHAALCNIAEKGALEESITRLKTAIDDLKEVTADIESVFFFLPQMPDFIETTERLSVVNEELLHL